MQTTHAQTPWHAPGLGEIHDNENRCIAMLSDCEPVREEFRPIPTVAEADINARLIVACVNRLSQFTVEQIEDPTFDISAAIEREPIPVRNAVYLTHDERVHMRSLADNFQAFLDAGCPYGSPYDTYPDDFYSAYFNVTGATRLLDAIDTLTAENERLREQVCANQ